MIAPRLALLAVTGAVAAGGVAGCAAQNTVEEKDFSGEASRVANTVRDLDDAYADEQADDNGARTVCRSLLSKRLLAAYGGPSRCEATVKRALDNSDPVKMDVRDVRFEGSDAAVVQARLKLDDDEQRIDTLRLVQEGRQWKFDGSTEGRRGSKVTTAATPATPAK